MKLAQSALFLATFCVLVAPVTAQDARPRSQKRFHADLTGPSEEPLSLLSPGAGHLDLTISDDETSVHFKLTYQGLGNHIRFSHIHVGKPQDLGGVTVFFCGGGGRDACPEGEGTVEGDFTADNVIGLDAQDLAANDLPALIGQIRLGDTYANLHTDLHPGGEIRGQILANRRGE